MMDVPHARSIPLGTSQSRIRVEQPRKEPIECHLTTQFLQIDVLVTSDSLYKFLQGLCITQLEL